MHAHTRTHTQTLTRSHPRTHTRDTNSIERITHEKILMLIHDPIWHCAKKSTRLKDSRHLCYIQMDKHLVLGHSLNVVGYIIFLIKVHTFFYHNFPPFKNVGLFILDYFIDYTIIGP